MRWELEGGRGWIILIQNNSLGGRISQHLGKEEMGLAKTQSDKAVTEQGTQEKRQFSRTSPTSFFPGVRNHNFTAF